VKVLEVGFIAPSNNFPWIGRAFPCECQVCVTGGSQDIRRVECDCQVEPAHNVHTIRIGCGGDDVVPDKVQLLDVLKELMRATHIVIAPPGNIHTEVVIKIYEDKIRIEKLAVNQRVSKRVGILEASEESFNCRWVTGRYRRGVV